MAKMTRIVLSYTVRNGSSDSYYDYDVRDEFYINASNPFLNDGDRGLEQLLQYLLDCSTRGGGHASGLSEYSNATLEVFETRNMRPPRREPAAAFYLSSIRYDAVNMAQGLEIAAVDYGSERLDASGLQNRQHELRKAFNKYRGLHRRNTSSDKLRSERLKRDRAAASMVRLLTNSDKSAAKVRESDAFKKLIARRDKAISRLSHLEDMRDRNQRMMSVYRDELKNVQAQEAAIARQERAHQQERRRRIKERTDDMRARHRLYRTGQRPTAPHDLNKTASEIEAEVDKELAHEHQLKTDPAYAAEHHRTQQLQEQEQIGSATQAAMEFIRRRSENEDNNDSEHDMPTN